MILQLTIGGCTAVAVILVAIVIWGDLERKTDIGLVVAAAIFAVPPVGRLIAWGIELFTGDH